jgi:hypothetical protein
LRIVKKKMNKSQASTPKSYIDSDYLDEEDLMKVAKKDFKNLQTGRFSLYTKYLNVIMLKTGDPYLSKMYEKYLKFKRKGRD